MHALIPLAIALIAVPETRDEPITPPAAQADASPSAALEGEREIAGHVSDERAAQLVRDLVEIGPRMGGTASGARAAARLATEFESIGLTVGRHLAPERWCHEETAWKLEVTIGNGEKATVSRAWPWGFSPAGAGADVPLGLTPGEGLGLLTGSFRGTPRKGSPVAVVLCDDANNLDGTWPLCRPHPRGHRARVAVFGIPDAEGARLRTAIESGETVMLDWSLETTILEAQPVSIVASLAPEKPSTGHLLICAHGDSDSGGPGANDNASGVAIVVEIARAWTAAIERGELKRPPLEVRFAIWGTEIHSTRAYMESESGAGCLGVLNFDQAGFGSTGQRLHVEPDDIPANVRFVETAASVLLDHAGTPGFPARWATNKSLGGTDSYVYSGSKRFRSEGLPAVTVFTSAWGSPDEQPRTSGMPGESWRDRERVEMDYDVHYHSAGDTPQNTTDKEPENMGWCARVGFLSVLRFLAR